MAFTEAQRKLRIATERISKLYPYSDTLPGIDDRTLFFSFLVLFAFGLVSLGFHFDYNYDIWARRVTTAR
jgi:hypothetical protein